MNNENQEENIFLDTAFLASFSIDSHKDFSKAQKLLAKLILNGYKMHTSPLCFYELWKVVKEYNDFYKGNYRFIRKINKILKFIHLKIVFNEINFSFKQIIKTLDIATKKIINSKFITVAQLGNNNIALALNAIDEFDQKPGDAFHFSIMKDLGINSVVTGDKKGFRRMGLKVIWF